MIASIFRLLPMSLAATLSVAGPFATVSLAQDSRGEVLLSRHCAMCHAIGPTGGSPYAAAPPFRILGQRYPLNSLEEALGEGLLSGHPEMPEFRFAPQDVGAIIRYLRSIQQR
jgi:cytochrome c